MARKRKTDSLTEQILKLQDELIELEEQKQSKLEELIESQVKLKIGLEQEKQKIRAEISQISKEERAARTHALCVIGGLWGKYVGDLDFEFCDWLLKSINRDVLDDQRKKYEHERASKKSTQTSNNPALPRNTD